MKIYASQLLDFSLAAQDGEIGKVKDIYFDDSAWTIRYLVVETGNWLFHRRVLISPLAVEGPIETRGKLLPLSLTKEQVRNSPDIDVDMPVSLQQESSLFNHYSWVSFGRAGMGWPPTGVVKATSASINKVELQSEFDPHLRSFRHVKQYEVHNEAGRIGLVKNFIVDLASWSVSYLLLDDILTSNKERVVVSTSDIISIDWETFQVKVWLTNEDVKNAVVINAEGFFNEESGSFPPDL